MAETKHPGRHSVPGSPAHEPSEIRPGGPLIFTIGLLLTVGIIMVVSKVVLDHLEAIRPKPAKPPALVEPSELPPAPRLETAPRRSLQELRAREDAILGSYGWVDRKEGVIRLPIDRAMEVVSRRGLPVRGSAPASSQPAGKEEQR